MEQSVLLIAVYVLYLSFVGYVYGRQRRWAGAAGWAMVVGGLLLAFGGAGDAFPWAGLVWSFIAGAGVILMVMEIALRRRRDP